MAEEKYNTKDIKHIDEKSQEYIAKGNRMTEEIIIDGVNVAGCKFYDKRAVLYDCTEDTTSGDNDCYRCKDEPNCYYKQLKRLEQENKELSFAIEKCLENAGIECDDEEQALRSLPMLGNAHYKILVEKEALEQKNKDLKEEIAELRKDCNHCNFHTYRSALEEIRILATKNVSIENFVKIQNKINEVLQ